MLSFATSYTKNLFWPDGNVISIKKQVDSLYPFFLMNEIASVDFFFSFSTSAFTAGYSVLVWLELFALILFQIPEEVNQENKRRKTKNKSKALALGIKNG